MNVIAKDVAATGFDLAAWHEELLKLNPWARGLTIEKKNEEFAAVRQKATLSRHAEGKEVWNEWANAMLVLKTALESAGQWAADRSSLLLRGENEATRTWLALACAVFSTRAAPHRFEVDASFDEYIFSSDADFDGATFSGHAIFSRATFAGWANFTYATFCRGASFNYATSFSRGASFYGATFSDTAEFGRATFSGLAEFEGATFSDGAGFDSAIFSGGAWFYRATFSGSVALFNGATFTRGAGFGRATFSGPAGFDGATFSGDTTFRGATFEAFTYLDKVRFNAAVDFAQAKFRDSATFVYGRFAQSANFEAITSLGTFSLADATFRRVPSLFGANFKGALRLDNIKMPRHRWSLGYTPDKDATARFRELRRRAVEAQDRDRELEFFAQERRTGRFHAKGLPPWVPKLWSWRFWFGLSFGAFSDFGRSLWRPLLIWLALTAAFAAFFLGEHEDMRRARTALGPAGLPGTLAAYAVTTRDALANPPACRVQGHEPFASTDAVAEAIQLAFRNGLVFDVGRVDSARRTYGCLFGLDKDGDQQYLRVPARVATASTLQTLASGLLIFLFLLAGRNLLRLR